MALVVLSGCGEVRFVHDAPPELGEQRARLGDMVPEFYEALVAEQLATTLPEPPPGLPGETDEVWTDVHERLWNDYRGRRRSDRRLRPPLGGRKRGGGHR